MGTSTVRMAPPPGCSRGYPALPGPALTDRAWERRLDGVLADALVERHDLGARAEQVGGGVPAVHLVGPQRGEAASATTGTHVVVGGPRHEVRRVGRGPARVLAVRRDDDEAVGLVGLVDRLEADRLRLAGASPEVAGGDEHRPVARVVEMDGLAVLVPEREVRGDVPDVVPVASIPSRQEPMAQPPS